MLSNRQLFLQYVAQTSTEPLQLEIDRAEGIYLYDTSGKAHIDLIAGISVSNVGHRHPHVLAAIHDQLNRYMHTMVYGEFVQAPQVLLAEALATTLPDPIDQTFFVNSGSEAIEGALKLAKRYTGRPHFLTAFKAYHGSSHGALSASGDEGFKQNFRPLVPGFQHFHYNCLGVLDAIDERTAAVLVESVQGEAGIVPGEKAFFQELRRVTLEKGALLILDEIQTGFGRTGRFWGFEHLDIVPDIVVSAKGMGGGMPIGAFMASKALMSTLTHHPILGHITTFGGHPVSAAASLATLEVIREGQLMTAVPEKNALFNQLLQHPAIRDKRSLGLMMALEFDSFMQLKKIIDRAVELGVITDWFLFNDRSMRIAPPLIITELEIKKACNLVLQAIDDVVGNP